MYQSKYFRSPIHLFYLQGLTLVYCWFTVKYRERLAHVDRVSASGAEGGGFESRVSQIDILTTITERDSNARHLIEAACEAGKTAVLVFRAHTSSVTYSCPFPPTGI